MGVPVMMLSPEEASGVGEVVAEALTRTYGPDGAMQFAAPIAVVLTALEAAGALMPLVPDTTEGMPGSVRTEPGDDDTYIIITEDRDAGDHWVERWRGKGFVASTATMIDLQKIHKQVALMWTRQDG